VVVTDALQNGRRACADGAWARAVEKLHRRQEALKEREAAVSPMVPRRAEPAGKPQHPF